jgi:ABC-type multidrug transport system fused ATPase/permease subunit
LTKRLRSKAFRATLRQEVAYFDDPKNNTGALCTRLATEASAVQGATGVRIGLMLQNVVSLGGGIVIGFVFSWQLTLLVLAFVPLMVIGGALQSRLMTGFSTNDKQTMEDTGKVRYSLSAMFNGSHSSMHCRSLLNRSKIFEQSCN